MRGQPRFVPPTTFTADPCSFKATFPTIPGWTPQVLTHTHPRPAGSEGCVLGKYFIEGPTLDDWDALDSLNAGQSDPVDGCLIQPRLDGSLRIYCYPDPDQPGKKKYTRYKRQPDGCYAKKT